MSSPWVQVLPPSVVRSVRPPPARVTPIEASKNQRPPCMWPLWGLITVQVLPPSRDLVVQPPAPVWNRLSVPTAIT